MQGEAFRARVTSMSSARIFMLILALLVPVAPGRLSAGVTLPKATVFKGEGKFRAIMAKAQAEKWSALPPGRRMTRIAGELAGTPYVGYTLEIDDKVESPSVNLEGLDCWTFFEAVLGISRMLETPRTAYSWEDLLREIEWTRYRGGRCTGGYLERIHYLDEWFFDNAARGNVDHLSAGLPGAVCLRGRESTEMTNLWKGYRYLRENPSLRPAMRQCELRVESLPICYVPKAKVPAMEGKLQDGDVIGIVTTETGGVCSHVGLAVRTEDGVLHFMHASRNYKKVLVDKRLSGYLDDFSHHAGIMVARPLPVASAVRDEGEYKKRLARLMAGK